jgi:TonB family protein
MIKQFYNQKLLMSGLLIIFVLSQRISIEGKTQAVKSKPKVECAKCPTSNQSGEPCPDCPSPVDVDPHSEKLIFIGFYSYVQHRHDGSLSGSVTRRVEPKYPEEAKKKGIKGNVVVEVNVDEEGKVTSARALTGNKLLRDAAIEAAKGWRFIPTQLKGKPVKVVGRLTFVFKNTKATK